MVLTARYRVHAVSVDPEGRYHVAMEPVYEGAEENAEAFAGKPAGLVRLGPLHAEVGAFFKQGSEVLADFEVLEQDIEDVEGPAPLEPLTPEEIGAAYARGLSQATMQAALDSAASNLPTPTPAADPPTLAPATDPAPEPEPAPAEPAAEDPAPASEAPAAEPEAQDAPPASTDQGYPGYGSSY